jgi:hypothetical protein
MIGVTTMQHRSGRCSALGLYIQEYTFLYLVYPVIFLVYLYLALYLVYTALHLVYVAHMLSI